MPGPSDNGPDRPGQGGGWIFGPAPDLILGCGLGYAALVLLLFLLRPDMARLSPWLPLLILLSGVPHYGATLQRVYASTDSCRRYARPAFGLSALVLCAFVLGIHHPLLGCWLITGYLTLSPWHYAAQNYGLTLLFLRRRGVPVGAPVRRPLRLSFLLSYALVFSTYHRAGAGAGSDPLYAASAAYRFLPLGLPARLLHIAVPLLLLGYAGCLFVVLWRLLRHNRPALVGPAAALLGTQAVWFSLPALFAHFLPGSYPGQHAALAFIWVALGHCVQYLWISLHHARASGAAGREPGSLIYLGKVTLLGATLWTVPALLFAPGDGPYPGGLPFDLGLGLLIAAAVNLHHFLLDGAIWKLRDPRVGPVLLRTTRALPRRPSLSELAARRPLPTTPFPALRWSALLTIGGISVLCWIMATWEREIGHRALARGDVARLLVASQRLAAVGRDGPQIHTALGQLLLREDHLDAAIAEYRRSLALYPTASAFVGLGRASEAQGDLVAAEKAYEAALRLDPGHAAARRHHDRVAAAAYDLRPKFNPE